MYDEKQGLRLAHSYSIKSISGNSLREYPVSELVRARNPAFGRKSKEKPIDPAPADKLRFARTIAFIPMTSLYRHALPVPDQSARSPFAYLFWSRTSS